MIRLLSFVGVGLCCFFAVCTSAADDEPQRPVRFAWFIDFSPAGNWLVAPYGGWDGDEGGEVRVWDVKTGEAKFVIPSSRGVRAAAWSPKGTFFASGNYGGEIRLYEGHAIGEFR